MQVYVRLMGGGKASTRAQAAPISERRKPWAGFAERAAAMAEAPAGGRRAKRPLDPGLPPEEAIRYLRAKGYAIGFDWRDVWREEHFSAFTVAKVADLDLLADIRGELDKALAEGTTLRDFRRELEPLLKKKGWWGRGEVVDPKTGEVVTAQLGSPHRLETIFRTNLRTAYANGHWDSIERLKERRPYLRYVAVMDGRTRPEHRAWHGTILPVDDEWWQTHAPPNGWMCRCRVISLSEGQMSRAGWKVSKRPESPTRPVLNKRTGEVAQVPVGIDLGWDYNPGRGANRRVEAAQNLASKVEAEREDAKKQAEDVEAKKKPAAKKRAAPRKKKPAGPKPVPPAEFHAKVEAYMQRGAGAAAEDKHRELPGYIDDMADDAGPAAEYIGRDYRALNRRLRDGHPPLNERQKAMLDDMQRKTVEIDQRILWRGISDEEPLIAAAAGDDWTAKSPISTSTEAATATNFGSGGVMAVHVKPGTRGVIWNAVEQEITLMPGTQWRVIKTQGTRVFGQRIRFINVEVWDGESDKMEGVKKSSNSAAAQDPRRPRRKSSTAERWADESKGFVRLNADGTARDPNEQAQLDRSRAQLRKLGFIK